MKTNFEQFLVKYPLEQASGLPDQYNRGAFHFCKFLVNSLPNQSFGNGVITILTPEINDDFNDKLLKWFPKNELDYIWFARTWMGDVLGAGFNSEGVLNKISLIDFGGNDFLAIADNFEDFFKEITFSEDHNNPILEPQKFEYWSIEKKNKLGPDRCVGYKVPMFLGGEEEIENQELIDVDVYWHLTFQIMLKEANH